MKPPIDSDLTSASVTTDIPHSEDKTKTSSSIIEFLNNEKECSNLADNGSEIDIDSIFEEINRLSDESDERSVDEILREAELLLSNQQQIESDSNTTDSNVPGESETNEDTYTELFVEWHPCENLETISEKSTPLKTKSQSSECQESTVLQLNNVLELDEYVSAYYIIFSKKRI